MEGPRVALMSGSTRAASVHRRLAAALAPLFAERGLAVDTIDLAEFPMPIYDGDLEDRDGAPAAAHELTELLAACHALVFVTPEHNGGPSALLKNSIDWVTRVDRGVFKPLVIGLAAASPGSRGGAAGLATMQRLVEHMRLELSPVQLSIPHSGDAFGESGDGSVILTRPDDVADAERFVDALVAALAGRSADAVAG